MIRVSKLAQSIISVIEAFFYLNITGKSEVGIFTI